MTLGDINTATGLRDLFVRIAQREARKVHPPPTYGEVVSFDRRGMTAEVMFPGSVEPVSVRMGSVQPQQAGQKVRVSPVSGNLFIEDVIGPAFFMGVSSVIPDTETGDAGGFSFFGGGAVSQKYVSFEVTDPSASTNLAVGNGQGYYLVPHALDQSRLKSIVSGLAVPSTSGTVEVTVRRIRAGSGTSEMLDITPRIEANTINSVNSTTQPAVESNVGARTVQVGDILRFDILQAGTGAKGLLVGLTFD
jgi:hypothetical protein